MTAEVNYFAELFSQNDNSKNNNNVNDYLNNIHIENVLNEKQKVMCDSALSLFECNKAIVLIQDSKLSKSPGAIFIKAY